MEQARRTTLVLCDENTGVTATCERTGRDHYRLEICDGQSTNAATVNRTVLRQVLRSGTTIQARI